MRCLIALLLCGLMLSASPARGEQAFPYTACINVEDVYVRSGPGRNYYPTEKLRRGQEVEVYRHDPGGWCAIRPVEGSYTWVHGRYLKPTEDNLAVVTEDGVSARVGSHFSDLRDVIQVRLEKGELVEVLEGPPQGSRGSEDWYKIAPPSGEFRWVSSKYLAGDYPRDGLRKTLPEDAPTAYASHPARPEDGENSDATPEIPESARREGPVRTRSLTAEEYEAELARIELELSVMVIEDPATWSFQAMRDRTNMLLDQAQTAVERGRARLLANKIARFDDIKQRQDAVYAMRDDVDRDSRLMARLRPSGDKRPDVASDIDDRFDGVGQLTQVVSPKLGAPRYALTDDSGNVRCYVTPAPGLNMQNYLGRRIGVTGTRGFVPEQHASHIMARHVTPLEGRMLR